MRPTAALILAAVGLAACSTPDYAGDDGLGGLPEAETTPPAWAADAVWYRVDVDRFRNGDPANDPTADAVAQTDGQADALRAAGWAVRDWTSAWTERSPWERALRPDSAAATLALRRYGGDLRGITDALPYLDSLGVTAVVLTGLADAQSPHHVDPHLGPDPGGDRERAAVETPDDPETWATTEADGQLLDLVAALHRRGVRVVLDVPVGRPDARFWAYRAALDGGPTRAWYARPPVEGRPVPPYRVRAARGGPGRGAPLDGDLAPGPRDYALALALRWLDPDGDGDPADGVDGFHLSGADALPLGAWRDLRRVVKAVHPGAVLVGDLGRRPGGAGSPAPFLGDAFDAVALLAPVDPLRRWLDPAGPGLSAVELAADLEGAYAAVPPDHLPAMWSVTGAPGDARTAAARAAGPDGGGVAPSARPDSTARQAARLARLLQVTLPGAPVLRAGDEVGAWGDAARPMLWPDLRYAPETDSAGRAPVAPDPDLLAFTRRALALRTAHPDVFARGALAWDPTGETLRFTRRGGGRTAVVVVNLAGRPVRAGVPTTARVALAAGPPPTASGGTFTLAPRAGAAFLLARDR